MPTNAELIQGFKGIIHSLERVIEKYPRGILNMWEARIFKRDKDTGEIVHPCGTVHCFAGWWGVANIEFFDISSRYHVGFGDAINLMAKTLGFVNEYAFMRWLNENPEIWGNEHGENLFHDIRAFNNAKSLKGIVRHLKGVVRRLEKLTVAV